MIQILILLIQRLTFIYISNFIIIDTSTWLLFPNARFRRIRRHSSAHIETQGRVVSYSLSLLLVGLNLELLFVLILISMEIILPIRMPC